MLSVENKMSVFNAFILSNFNYCSLVWHNCGVTNSRKLEKIQERGLRFVFNDFISSYNVLLENFNKDLLYIGHLKSLAGEVYKTTNELDVLMLYFVLFTNSK